MTQVDYSATVEKGKVRITISFPDGHEIQHSIPRGVLESKDDPQAELERIVTERAEAETWPDATKPDWLIDSGSVKID